MRNDYKIDKESGLKVGYLKCNYSRGMFDHEYQIRFKAQNQNWCFVNRTDVVASNEKRGYVKVLIQNEMEKRAIVLINDTGDHRLSGFKVLTKDLVSKVENV
jgi:hypothetical protein